MNARPLRLAPGDDLRGTLEAAVGTEAGAFVICGIGSLRRTRLRLAGADAPIDVDGDVELLTLSGSIAANGAHLHMTVADADGRVTGGHVAPGCIVRTTAEVLVAVLADWRLDREADAATGYDELVVRSVTSRP